MDQMVLVNGVELFVRVRGVPTDDPPVFVFHGGPDVGHSYLLPGLNPLSDRRQVIAFDFRGTGKSARGLPDDQLQPEHVVDDALALLDHLQLDEVDLLGFSTGGRAAMEFVHRYGDRVRRLVLASTSAYPGDEVAPLLADNAEYQRRQEIEAEAAGRLRGSTLFVWDLERAPAYLAMIADLDEGDWSYERVLDGSMHPWCTADPVEVLREWGRPVLIIHGERDMSFPLPLAERLHDQLPTSRLAVIENTAHMCQFEKPEEWASVIAGFLQSRDGE